MIGLGIPRPRQFFNRISLDLDGITEYDLLTVVGRLRGMGFDPAVFQTENGFHVVAYFPEGVHFSVMEVFQIREELGDDPRRIYWDMRHIAMGKTPDLLFYKKNGVKHRLTRIR